MDIIYYIYDLILSAIRSNVNIKLYLKVALFASQPSRRLFSSKTLACHFSELPEF